MKAKTKKYIQVKTAIPGPKAKELLGKKEENVPRGRFTLYRRLR